MPSTILSTHLVSQLPTSLGTMTVPITLRAAVITSSPPIQAAMTRSASGTTMALLDGSESAELTTPGSAGDHADRSRRARHLPTRYRPAAHFGAWLAALGGAWFALGGILGPTWSGIRMNPGTPVGGTTMRAVEQIGFFAGLGVVIVAVAAMALGRFSVISVRDAKRAERTVSAAPSTPVGQEAKAPTRTGGFTFPLPIRRKVVTGSSTGAEADTERVDSAAASP